MSSIDRFLALLMLAEAVARKHNRPKLVEFVRCYTLEVLGGGRVDFFVDCSAPL